MVDTKPSNFVAVEKLGSILRAFADFAKEMGVSILFFKGDQSLYGTHRRGVSYYNVDAKFSHEFVYWHEFGHWLKNNQTKLFQQLLDAAEITKEQIAEKRESRKDLTTDEEIKEEIICDAMSDMARRTGLLKQIGKKNPSLIERLASWAQSMLRRFTDWFHTKERGLNTEQRNRMFDVFGKVFRQIENANGNKIFRYNRRTHELEHIDGRKLETVDTSGKTKASLLMTGNSVDSKRISADNVDTISQTLFERHLTEGIMNMVKSTVEKEIGEYVNLSEMSDPVVRDEARDRLPYIRQMLVDYNLRYVQSNEYYKNRLATKIEYARRCFDNDERIRIETVRQMDRNKGQRGIRDTRSTTFSESNTRGTGEELRIKNVGISRNVSGGKSDAWNHFKKLYDEEAKRQHSGRQGAFSVDDSKTERGNKSKFSMDTSTDSERSFFGKAWDKFAKALHLKGDKIVTVEEQKKAQRQAQEKAMEAYLKEPTKENRKQLEKLKVTKGQLEAYKNGEEYDDEISLRQYTVASPSRIADKVAVFRAFYRMGERAMDKLVRLRSKYERKYNEVMSIVTKQEERENLFELLWKGDADQVEYGTLTENELAEIKTAKPNDTTKAIQRAKIEKICKEQNVSENVARAYLQTRRLITSAYHMINEARRHPQTLTKYLSDSAIDELKANKFVNVMHVSEDKDSSGRRRVTYKEYRHTQRSYFVTPADLARLERDDAIQIIDEKILEDGNYEVTVREGIANVNKLTGYIPHFFHEYFVVVKDANGRQVGEILFTGKTERDAIKLAEEWKKTHTLKEGEQIYISPRGLDRQLGMDAEKLAPIMGDKDLAKMLKRIASSHDMTLEQAKDFVGSAVRTVVVK